MQEFESERRQNHISDINSLLKNKIAIKWTAPEALESREYSYASEIWSFGITLWEMWSYGRVPYRKIFVQNVLEAVKKGTRCEIIECQEAQYRMPKDIEKLLTKDKIWALDPEKRPNIDSISGSAFKIFLSIEKIDRTFSR